MGWAYHRLGRHSEAVRLIEAATAWFDETGDDLLASGALNWLGKLHIELGRPRHAVAALAGSLERGRRIDYCPNEVETLVELAHAWRALGAPDKALAHAQEAVSIANRHTNPYLKSLARAGYAAISGTAPSVP